MLTVGDKLPVLCLDRGERHQPEDRFQAGIGPGFPREVARPLRLAEGFHLRLPDRDRRLRRAAARFRRPRRPVLGVSTDSDFVHLAWRNYHEDLGLRSRCSPTSSASCRSALGILHKEEGVALRATFIVDPEGIIRFVSVNDLSVGRNPEEVLRVLDALQTDELCPCNWQQGEETLKAA